MKFAKTLEDVMVPEWKGQYVQYKIGKKKIKENTNKLHTANSSPAISSLRRTASRPQTSPLSRPTPAEDSGLDNAAEEQTRSRGLSILQRVPSLRNTVLANTKTDGSTGSASRFELRNSMNGGHSLEGSPLHHSPDIVGTCPSRPSSYGSMQWSPPAVFSKPQPSRPPSLHLPAPMQPIGIGQLEEFSEDALESRWSYAGRSVYPTTPADNRSSKCIVSRPTSRSDNRSVPPKPFLRRMFTLGRSTTISTCENRLNITEVQTRAEKEFLKWLLQERQKCEEFYATREKEALKRFDEMQEQLDIMRERWFKAKHNIPFEEDDVEDLTDHDIIPEHPTARLNGDMSPFTHTKKRVGWKSVTDAVSGLARPHPTIARVNIMADGHQSSNLRDYERKRPCRKPLNNPAHRVAKRKLKKAYIEYYHGLEMLKSYVTINRECFRKITKKFDKASGLRTSHRFMTEYVDKSYFGGANNKLDDLLNDTESLFARFFERGNRKEASSRLRSRDNKTLYYASVWRSGFYLGLAVVIAAYGLYDGVRKIYDNKNPILALKTSYLLQIWGGVALMLAQVLLFAINLRVWAKNKINYSFIFEFDTRHMMNYRQFLELPAIFSLLFAICFWFSVHDFLGDKLDMIHFPIIFVVISSAILINPFKVFYYHSRKWFLRILVRLFLSGAFPVEFKDFWVGDMFCSQTYALGNIELFFCLYANAWENPTQCNSSHSRAMGFFTALPGLWRLLQCFRRYYSSKMWFPHLINGGKYAFTILHYMTLSIWRIDTRWNSAKAAFIVCASINSIYCTLWDVVMDWSLLDPYASRPFLRDNLGFKPSWPYYLAMFIDPIIRCDWFFYIIYAGRIQHSALLSFLLALTEVLRRFMWCFFRMENEHCGNVGANRAYRNLPLPYHFPDTSTQTPKTPMPEQGPEHEFTLGLVNHSVSSRVEIDEERMATLRHRASRGTPSSPMIRTMTRVGRSMTQAHIHDYERRRRRPDEEPESDSDDEEDGEDYYERTAEISEVPRLRRPTK